MWSIAVLKNEVAITEACAQDLFDAQQFSDEAWYEVEEIVYENRNGVRVLSFSLDDYEHMDFLATGEHFIEVLKQHAVEGDICFGSLEGDNAGQFWGYRFDGKGGMQELTGSVIWEISGK